MAQNGSEFNRDRVVARIRDATRANAKAAALTAERAVKKQLTGQRSGKMYKVSQDGTQHQASKPGESPAVLTGDLRGSITTAPDPASDTSYYVGSDKDYAHRLEKGTEHMEPRPYFEKAIRRVLRKIKSKMTTEVGDD